MKTREELNKMIQEELAKHKKFKGDRAKEYIDSLYMKNSVERDALTTDYLSDLDKEDKRHSAAMDTISFELFKLANEYDESEDLEWRG